MSCYSIVALKTNLKASSEEIEVAVKAMGLSIRSKNKLLIDCGDVSFSRPNEQSAWSVNTAGDFDTNRFSREFARAKVLKEAQRQGYRVTRDERQGERIVIRMTMT